MKVLAIVVIDEPRTPAGYANERLMMELNETPEAFAERVRARIVEMITKPGKR